VGSEFLQQGIMSTISHILQTAMTSTMTPFHLRRRKRAYQLIHTLNTGPNIFDISSKRSKTLPCHMA